MAHSKAPCSHDENRAKVCVVCMQKAKYPLTEIIINRIQAYFITNYDKFDCCLPCGICGKCRSDLLDISKGKKDTSILPQVYDFSDIIPSLPSSTRANPHPICDCCICDIARQSGTTIPSRKKGRPFTSTTSYNSFRQAKSAVTICTMCKSPIGRGISHKCNISTFRENMIAMCQTSDERTKEILASSVIKEKAEQSKSTDIRLATRGPNLLPIISTSRDSMQHPTFKADDLSMLQTSLGVSNVAMIRKVVPFLRKMHGKRAVENFMDKKLQARDSVLADFFSTILLQSEEGPIPLIYCNNVAGLVTHVIEFRNLVWDSVRIKIGLDGGGGFFKVCLNIFEACCECPEEQQGSSKLLIDKLQMNTGVKRLLIIAIAPDMKESYGNVAKIMEHLDFESLPLKTTYAVDLKLANIIAGIQSHGCSYPCLWCECPKTIFQDVEKSRSFVVRSLGSVRSNAADFMNIAKGNKVFAKEYKSCVHPPLISGDDRDIFIQHLPPPELHLLLRITNKLFKELQKCDADIAQQWIASMGITQPQLHGGEFNGNMCRKMLQHAGALNKYVSRSHMIYRKICDFAACFDLFQQVVNSCFGTTLDSNFENCITVFRAAYMKLGITVTTSAHVLFTHVTQFCKLKKSSLGNFSEQASESVHSDFMAMWQQAGKVDQSHTKYSINLQAAVIRYNGRHL